MYPQVAPWAEPLMHAMNHKKVDSNKPGLFARMMSKVPGMARVSESGPATNAKASRPPSFTNGAAAAPAGSQPNFVETGRDIDPDDVPPAERKFLPRYSIKFRHT